MGERLRGALVTITSAPWRRAPTLLWRRPGVLATVAGACAVVAASLAAVPLFLSSVGTESVALQAGERCPRDTGASLTLAATPTDVTDATTDPFVPLSDQLGPSNRWVQLESLSLVGDDPEQDTLASLLVRDGALERTEIVEDSGQAGVWIPDRATDLTGLEAGDVAILDGVEVPIAGVYRDLAGSSVDDYWCSNGNLLLLEVRGADLVLPPPMLLADRETFARLMQDLEIDVAGGAWEAPLRPGVTVSQARHLIDQLACTTKEANSLAWCEGGQPALGIVTHRDFTTEEVVARDSADFVERFLSSSLPFVTARSRATQTSVGGGIWPIAGFAALAGVGLVAAAGSLWFDRRRREVTLLTTRGVSPAAIGLKAVLELVLPAVSGAAAGVAAAYGIVVWLGPSPALEPSALVRAAVAGAAALLLAAATIGVVVTGRSRSSAVRSPRRFRLGFLPWELALAWLTVVSYRRLGDWGVPVGRGADVSRVDVLGLLFPVLFLVTGVSVLSRLLSFGVRPLRSLSQTWPTALNIGIRRVARYRSAVLGLVAASAVSAGVLGYAATMNRSLDATLSAKSRTFVGTEVAARLAADEELPATLSDRSTEVRLHQDSWIDVGRREGIAVIVIDPATFETAAFWEGTFADRSLSAVLDDLDDPATRGAIPAVVVGIDAEGPTEVGVVQAGTTRIVVEPIDGVEAFPAMKRSEPTVFVAATALEGIEMPRGKLETWIGGDRDEVLAALDDAGVPFSEDRRLADIADGAAFLTVSWTFGFMQSLGITAGLLLLGGVAVYLDARRRDRLLGYAFMRRMGLQRAQHRRALLVELTASVIVGCWMGLGIALGAAWLAHTRVDPIPGFRPEPLLRPAEATIVGLAAAAVLITAMAAGMAQRRVDSDDPVEVLRAGI